MNRISWSGKPDESSLFSAQHLQSFHPDLPVMIRVKKTATDLLFTQNTLPISTVSLGYRVSIEEEGIYETFVSAISKWNENRDTEAFRSIFMAISLEGIHDIDKLTTYIRAAATLGYVTQLRTALILLYKLNQREFYQEVPTLLVVASGAPQFDYQIEAKPRTLRTIKRVIDSLNWDNGLENHPNRDIRRAILGDVEYRCNPGSSQDTAIAYWNAGMKRGEYYSFSMYFQYLVDNKQEEEAIRVGELGWLKTGSPQILSLLFSLESMRGNIEQATQYWLKLSTFPEKVLVNVGISLETIHQSGGILLQPGLPNIGYLRQAMERMIALESVHNFAPQDRVPDSNREQFAHMCLDEASMLGIQSLDSLKSRLSALQFPACVHPIYEGMIEFVRTHIVLLSLVPNALEELYAYYLTHSSESISAEIAVGAMTDSELEDKPQVNLKEVSAIPDMVNWSLRTGNPEDLIAGHFSALTSYCFFAQDIEILEEIEKFYDYFLKLVQDPDESHSQDYADIIGRELQRLMDSIDRRVLLPKSLQEYFEQSEQLLIESLGESNFRRLLASIFVDKDDATLHDRMYEVEFQNILSSGLDTAIALRLALYVRILAVLRLESHEKISSIVGAQQGVIWDDVSGRALLQLGALFPQDTITREEYSQISDLLSLENIQDLILHTRFFNTMIGEECDEMQRKIARTFLKKISELLPTLEGHEYQEAIVCTSLLELLLGNKSGLQTLTIAANEGNPQALFTLAQQAIYEDDAAEARRLYEIYVHQFLNYNNPAFDIRSLSESVGELMRLTFLANDFNNFTRYRDIALSQNIPDLDILEIQYVGMALDEQIGEEKGEILRDVRVENILHTILQLPDYKKEYLGEPALTGYGMYAVVRLEAIDTENLSLGNVTVYPSSELYLFSAAADLYEEQVLLNYFLLTATPFLIENMEEENRQEQAELRGHDLQGTGEEEIHIPDGVSQDSLYLEYAKSFIDGFVNIFAARSPVTSARAATILKKIENEENFIVTTEGEIEGYVSAEIISHSKTLCEVIPTISEKKQFLQYVASFFDQYLSSPEGFDKVEELYQGLVRDFFENHPDGVPTEYQGGLIRNQGGNQQDWFITYPFTQTGHAIH